ncbi:MAG: MFS transporter [Pseudomonadota bacterium]
MVGKQTRRFPFFQAWFIVGLGALFYSYEYFLRITPSVIFHPLMEYYHIDATGLGVLSGFYYWVYTPVQLFAGCLIDRFGSRKLLTLACFLCVIGTIFFAITHSIAIASVGRMLVGFGSGFAFVGAMQLAANWLPIGYFSFGVGAISTLGSVGAILGNLILTNLVKLIGWQETVYFSAVLGVFITIALFVFIKNNPPRNIGQIDDPSKHKIEHLTFAQILRGLIHSLTLPQFWLSGLIGALLYLALSAFAELWGGVYLTHVYHLTATQASWGKCIVFIGWSVGCATVGLIAVMIKRPRMLIRMGATGAFIAIAPVIFYSHLSIPILYTALFFYGAFVSVEILSFVLGYQLSDEKMAGTAVSLTNMIIMLGGVIFQPVIGILLDWHWSGQMAGHVRVYSDSDYRFAMSIFPLSMLLTFLLTFILKEPPQTDKQHISG